MVENTQENTIQKSGQTNVAREETQREVRKGPPLIARILIAVLIVIGVIIAALIITVLIAPDFSNDFNGFKDLINYILHSLGR